MRGKLHNRCFVEEDVGIRAVQRVYAEHSKVKHAETPTPKDIYEFATGSGAGDRQAAILAFETLGEAIGDALANAITLVDGLVVIGGGLSAAAPLFMPRLVAEMNGTIETLDGRQIPRMELKAFNLEDEAAFAAFARGEARRITVPGSTRQLTYDPLKRHRRWALPFGDERGRVRRRLRLRPARTGSDTLSQRENSCIRFLKVIKQRGGLTPSFPRSAWGRPTPQRSASSGSTQSVGGSVFPRGAWEPESKHCARLRGMSFSRRACPPREIPQDFTSDAAGKPAG